MFLRVEGGERPMSHVVSFSSLPVPSLYVVDGTDVHITQQCDGRAASIVLTEQRQEVLLPPVRLSQTESDNLPSGYVKIAIENGHL